MDYEDVANMSNYTFDEDFTPLQSFHYIFHEAVCTLFSVFGICADAAIIYTILRFGRMRTTENIFVANWAIADLCSLVVTPSGYRTISVVAYFSLSAEFFCSLFHIGATLHFTVAFFVIVVSIDWFLGAYFKKASARLRKYHKFIIGSIWTTCLLISGFTTGYSLSNIHTVFPAFILFLSIFAVLIITFALQCSRGVKKCLKKPLDYPPLKLTLTTAFAGCWLLAFFTLAVMSIGRLHPIIGIIAECAIFGSSIVNLSLLYRLDKDFQACLVQALRRSAKYEEPVCSFDNPIVKNRNGKDSVEVSFDNPNARLIDNMY